MPDDATTQTDAATTAGEPSKDAAATTAPTTDAKPDADALGDAGKRALDAERKRADDAEKELRRLQKAQADRDADEAKKRGDFEALAKKHADRVAELEAEIAKRDREALRAKVASAHKLPTDLAALLQGEDEAALTESAKLLAKHVVARQAPDTEAGAGAKGSAGASDRPGQKQSGDKTPGFTFDGRPKVAFPSR